VINISVKDIRQKLNMTQQEFAAYLGVAFQTVNRWETGDFKPSALATEKLLAALARSEKALRGKK
jgi:putative transcriptional regulator